MDERSKQLEDRNERLFETLGRVSFYLEEDPKKTYTVQEVKEILESIACRKDA